PIQKFRLKLAGLGLLAALLLGPLFVPIPSHAVLVDPSSPASLAKADQAAKSFERLQVLGTLDLIALACVLWLAWRVFRNRPG
ncbi:MAG TPA: hypothetical protein VHY57_10765, partial [Rhizomicrobium sp.]|nr:hypothetical protein [Rhizomicrobium sp.]